MSDSAPGIGSPARACPFVALDEDRDRRSSVPDPRHRCYAVPTPEQRALAHQEAYCLSPAFSSCTFFLDWAARAAANPVHTDLPTAATVSGSTANEILDRPERLWAAPPPWVARPALKTTRPPSGPSEQLAAFPEPVDHALEGRDLPADPTTRRPRPPAAPPGLEPSTPAAPQPAPAAPDYPLPFGEGSSPYAPQGPATWSKPTAPVGVDFDATPPILAPVAPAGRRIGRPVDAGTPPRIDRQARPTSAKSTDGSSDWARPRRFGAYPTLGRRVRLRGISPVVVGAFALMLAAVVLFLLPGFLSGQGGATIGSSNPSGSAAATVAAVTPRPAPTPRSYTVKKGDVLGTIAKSFGLTVPQIVCFNGLKNANVLAIGQVLLLPPPDFVCPPKGGATPKPSASPR